VFPAGHNRWVTFDCYGTLVRGTGTDQAQVVRPFEDIEPLLAELRLRGDRLGVLTNYDDARFEAAHRTFRQPFDLFVTANRIRGRKPDLWHFRAFQRLAQVQKDNWIHVSSDWEQDIIPAESFGMLWRALTWPGATPSTSHVPPISTSTTRSRWPTAAPAMTLMAPGAVPGFAAKRLSSQAVVPMTANTSNSPASICSMLPADTADGGGTLAGCGVSAPATAGNDRQRTNRQDARLIFANEVRAMITG